jgi:methionine synthase II (cobalamin-independent)
MTAFNIDRFTTSADVVQVLCEEVAELVRLGCTYIQLDAPPRAGGLALGPDGG